MHTSPSDLARALSRALFGDASAVGMIAAAEPAELVRAASKQQLVLGPTAVASTLTGYLEGRLDAKSAQAWASLMLRGFVGRSAGGPVQPVDIQFDAEYEDAIVEALVRLDELGDLVDGLIDPGEGQRLLRSLGLSADGSDPHEGK